MNLVQDPTLVDVAGGILTALGITLAILENRRSF